MNIDDPLRVAADKLWREDLHVAGQDDRVDLFVLEQLEFLLLPADLCFFFDGEDMKGDMIAFGEVSGVG